MHLISRKIKNLEEIKKEKILRVHPLIDDYTAISLAPGAQQRVIGSFELTKLFQSESSYTHFIITHFDQVNEKLEIKHFSWLECPHQRLTSINTCQNLFELKDELFLHIPKEQNQLPSKNIFVADSTLSFLHLRTQTIQSITIKGSQEFSLITTIAEGNILVKVANRPLYALYYLPFAFPIEFDFQHEFGDFVNQVSEGASGILLLVEFSLLSRVPPSLPTSIADFVNYYIYFKTRNLSRDLKKPDILDALGRASVCQAVVNSYRQCIDRIFVVSQNFYVLLDNCNPGDLMLMLLHQFRSLAEMDAKFGVNRFTASLANFLIKHQASSFLFVFSKGLERLHSQAAFMNISLRPFYEVSAIKVQESLFEAKDSSQSYRDTSASPHNYIQSMRKASKGHRYQLQIYRSRFKFPPNVHHISRGLCNALAKTSDLDIFQSRLIQLYVELKWKSAQIYFILDSLLLTMSIVFLFIHSLRYRGVGVLVPLLALQIWTLTLEIIELVQEKGSYFKTYGNILDLGRISLTAIYFFIVAGGTMSQQNKALVLTFLNLLFSLKALSVFALMKSTRVLRRIVIEIAKDMIPFMIFCLLVTVLLALLYTSALSEDQLESRTYPTQLFHVFLLDYGDFSADDYSDLEVFIFIVAALFMPLVMLNMLIAIMGDTYDRVKEDQARRDFHQLAQLLYKYEVIMSVLCCCNKKRRAWKYIYFSQEAHKRGGEQTAPQWEGRVKGIKTQIMKSQKALQDEIHILNQKTEALHNRHQETDSSMIESMVAIKQMVADLNVRLDQLEKPLRQIPQLKRLISDKQIKEMNEEVEEENNEESELNESGKDSPMQLRDFRHSKPDRKEGSLFKGALNRFKETFI